MRHMIHIKSHTHPTNAAEKGQYMLDYAQKVWSKIVFSQDFQESHTISSNPILSNKMDFCTVLSNSV